MLHESADSPTRHNPAEPPPGHVSPGVRQEATRVLLGLNLAAFGLSMVLSKGRLNSEVLLLLGANDPALVWQGEWWRLLASAFLHGSVLHLAMNMWALWVLGPLLERELGPWRLVLLYLGSALTGSAASVWLGAGAMSLGASGAIFGMVGALWAFTFVAGEKHHPAALASMRRQLMWTVILNLLGGVWVNAHAAGFQVDNSAHLGGLWGGTLLGAGLFASLRLGSTSLPATVALTAYTLSAAVGLGMASHAPTPAAHWVAQAQLAARHKDVPALEEALAAGFPGHSQDPAFLAARYSVCALAQQPACKLDSGERLLGLDPLPAPGQVEAANETLLLHALSMVAAFAMAQQDFSAAAAFSKRVTQLRPEDEDGFNNAAWFMLRQGGLNPAEQADALDLADRARRLSSHDVLGTWLGPNLNILHTYAEALRQSGRLEDALAVLQGFREQSALRRHLMGSIFTPAVIDAEMQRMRAGRPPLDLEGAAEPGEDALSP